MADTPRLNLPLLSASQSQKHVTLNEALLQLDAVSQLSVEAQQNDPPVSASNGQSYIVGSSPTGGWFDQAGNIATWYEGAWRFIIPTEGFLAYNIATGLYVRFDGASWVLAFSLSGDVWGWQNYQHAGASVPLTSAGVWYDLVNDGAGGLTDSTTYTVPSVGPLWDTSTNRIDLSDTSVGDRVHLRIDVTPTTASANTSINLRIVLQEGILDVPIGTGGPLYYKTSGTQSPVTVEPSITIFTSATRDAPAIIQAMSDTAGASIAVSGWTFEHRVR